MDCIEPAIQAEARHRTLSEASASRKSLTINHCKKDESHEHIAEKILERLGVQPGSALDGVAASLFGGNRQKTYPWRFNEAAEQVCLHLFQQRCRTCALVGQTE